MPKELGASELNELEPNEAGFLFGYQLGIETHQKQVGDRPDVRDRPEEREELVRLNDVLRRLEDAQIDVPTPKTWILEVDQDPPSDLSFPLFLRTPKSSWKRGGQQAKANNPSSRRIRRQPS